MGARPKKWHGKKLLSQQSETIRRMAIQLAKSRCYPERKTAGF
jgi:hypothetical protein